MSKEKQSINDFDLYAASFNSMIFQEFGSMSNEIQVDSLDLFSVSPLPSPQRTQSKSLTSPPSSPPRALSPSIITNEMIKASEKARMERAEPMLPFAVSYIVPQQKEERSPATIVQQQKKKKKSATEEQEKRAQTRDLNSARDMQSFINQCTGDNIRISNEVLIFLEGNLSKLGAAVSTGLKLHFHYELFSLTYFMIHELAELVVSNYQFNKFKVYKSDHNEKAISGSVLAEKWDEIMDRFEEELRSVISKVIMKQKKQRDRSFPFSFRIAALFAFVQKYFGIYNVVCQKKYQPSGKDETFTCSVTGKDLTDAEQFNVYQVAMCSGEKEVSEMIHTYPIAYVSTSGVDNILINFVVTLISFFSYRAVIGKQITIWREKQRFTNSEALETKLATFKKEKTFVFERLYEFALLYNHFVSFVQVMNQFRE